MLITNMIFIIYVRLSSSLNFYATYVRMTSLMEDTVIDRDELYLDDFWSARNDAGAENEAAGMKITSVDHINQLLAKGKPPLPRNILDVWIVMILSKILLLNS